MSMTSDSAKKTLAFLARRVEALEKRIKEQDEVISAVEANQAHFRPIVEDIFEGITLNAKDHEKILKHLGIE